MITLLDDVEVKLLRCSGGDDTVVQAARVSVEGGNEVAMTEKNAGLINYLMRKRHGTPFEQNSMSFFVKAPIFAVREFQRHRIGWSYSEMSARYMALPGEFYVPKPDRKLVNVGTSANPKFEPGTERQVSLTAAALEYAYSEAWDQYEYLLENGIANEVARMVLPVGIMTQMQVTCNARSLMQFLGLRTSDERATFPSNPQHEIEIVARKMETEFAILFPVTHEAFNRNGRVSP